MNLNESILMILNEITKWSHNTNHLIDICQIYLEVKGWNLSEALSVGFD